MFKLFYYNFKQVSKNMLYGYALVLGLALVLNLCTSILSSDNQFVILLITIEAIAVVALMVVTIVAAATTFYKTCYGRQGYLTFTLPLTSAQILGAAFLSGLAVVLMSLVVLAVAVPLSVPFHLWRAMLEMIAYELNGGAVAHLLAYFGSISGMIASAVICLVFWICMGLLQVYVSISIGQCFTQRVAAAFIAFFVLSALQNTVITFLTNQIAPLLQTTGQVFVYQDLLCLVFGGVYAAITIWVMTHKLNLE